MNTHTQPRCPPRSKTPCTHIKQEVPQYLRPASKRLRGLLTAPLWCIYTPEPKTQPSNIPKPDSC